MTPIWRNERVLRVASIAFILVFGAMYVAQMNDAAAQGYAIRDLEKEAQSIKRDHDRLLAEVDRLRSLQSVRERQAFLGLVPAQNISFIEVPAVPR